VDLLLCKGIKAVPWSKGKGSWGSSRGDLLARAGMPLRLDVQDRLPGGVRKEHLRRLDDQGLTAADVMTAPVATLNIKTKVPDAWR
jgi:hypothetical protein